MLTARKYRNRASKLVILSICSRLKDSAFDLRVPCEIGHGFEPSSFIFLRGTFALCRRVRRTADQRHSAELLSGAVRRSFKARNGSFESTSLQRRGVSTVSRDAAFSDRAVLRQYEQPAVVRGDRRSISSARIVISRMQHCAVPTARP